MEHPRQKLSSGGHRPGHPRRPGPEWGSKQGLFGPYKSLGSLYSWSQIMAHARGSVGEATNNLIVMKTNWELLLSRTSGKWGQKKKVINLKDFFFDTEPKFCWVKT